MAEFRYVAVDPAGVVRRGMMVAADEAGAVATLQRQGYIPLRAQPNYRSGWLGNLAALEFTRRRGITRREVVDLTRELATMLGAGQNLDMALRFLVETTPVARVREVIGRIREKVRGGSTFASTLAAEPRSFSHLYVSLIRAGEAGGRLGETLERLAALLERQRSLAATVQAAMVYPVLLLVTAIGSVTLLVTKVLPEFTALFAENGAALPASTRMLIGFGNFIGDFGIWLVLGLLVLGLAGQQALKQRLVRRAVDGLVLRLPLIGVLLRRTLAARFSRTLGTLLLNGVPLIGALAIARDTLANSVAVDAVDWAITRARSGAGVAQPLDERKVFPPRLIHLLRLGEETAQLGPMCLKAAEIHEEETRLAVQRLVSLLVPAITIVMGAVVAFIIGSLLQAMLSLNDLAG